MHHHRAAFARRSSDHIRRSYFSVTVSWWRRAAIIVVFRDETTSHDVQIGNSDLLQTRCQHVVIKRRYKNVMDDYKKRQWMIADRIGHAFVADAAIYDRSEFL
jgi:hypothetical protein